MTTQEHRRVLWFSDLGSADVPIVGGKNASLGEMIGRLAPIARLIEVAHAHGRKVGLCGQAPSDDPTYARFLVETGIDSISVTPDSFVAVKRSVAESEETRPKRAHRP